MSKQDADQLSLIAIEEALVVFVQAYAHATDTPIGIEPDCVWMPESVPFAAYGGVMRHRFTSENVEERIEAVSAQARQKETNPLWWVTPLSTPSDLGEHLERAGAQKIVQLTEMAIHLDDLAPQPVPKGVQIIEATTPEHVEQYARIYPLLFGDEKCGWIEDLVRAELASFAAGDTFHRWLALRDGEPVAAAMACAVQDVAILQTLCTLPEHRNQGIGASLLQKAMAKERNSGCSMAGLGAGPGAENLYSRLGYSTVGHCDLYLLP